MKRIIVVDDDPNLRALVSDLLTREGYAVQTCSSGPDCISELLKKPADLMLLDLNMPGMDGIDVLSNLRKAGDLTRIIVLTANDTPESVLAAVRVQAYQYITKPFDPAGLMDAVRKALAAPVVSPIEIVSATPNWVELVVPCDVSTAERIQNFMDKLKADLPSDVREAVGYAFRELLMNAIEWGGKLDPNRKVRISYIRSKRMLMYRIADPGPGFKFDEIKHAAIANTPEAPFAHDEVRQQQGMRPGGFGILMTQAIVDELIYNEAQNEVVFLKFLNHENSAPEV